MMHYALKDLIELSKDGEWGKGEPFAGSVEMVCVRGTDFSEVRNGCLAAAPRRHIPAHIAAYKSLRPWDLLIETAGGTKGQITGRTVLMRPGLFRRTRLPITCASFSRFIRVDTEAVDPEYLFWHLQHLYSAGFLHAYHTQHTGVARFQWTTFSNREPIDLPARPAQRKIAAILSAYDDLIENNLRRIKILEEMARSLYREWFVEFRFPGHQKVRMVNSPLGKIPEGWEVAKLASVANVNRLQIKGSKTPPDTIHYIDIASVSPGRVDAMTDYQFSDAPGRARRIVRHGDIIWSCVRPNRRSHALIIHPPENTVASTGFAILSAKSVPYSYLYQATTTDEFVGYLANNATGAAYPAVTASTFESAEIIVPAGKLLKAFSEIADPIAGAVNNYHQRNAVLRQTRDLLLPKLISGDLDVSDGNIKVRERSA